jgi:hypothetical protein
MNKFIYIVCLFIFFLPIFLFADFTGMNFGAKALAMGNAYISVADEPSAIFWNPAGIAYQNKYVVSLSHENIYAIPGFYNDLMAINLPFKPVHIGIGWSQIMLSGEYAEQVTILNGAFRVLKNGDFNCAVGVNAKHFYAHLLNVYQGSNPSTEIGKFNIPGKFDIDAGTIIKYQHITLGASARNLMKSSFKFDRESQSVLTTYGVGVNYAWAAGLVLSGDYQWDKENSSWNLGSEIWFYNVFAPRLGVSDSNLTAGFGLKTAKWMLDGAVYAHETLGSTYRIEISWIF